MLNKRNKKGLDNIVSLWSMDYLKNIRRDAERSRLSIKQEVERYLSGLFYIQRNIKDPLEQEEAVEYLNVKTDIERSTDNKMAITYLNLKMIRTLIDDMIYFYDKENTIKDKKGVGYAREVKSLSEVYVKLINIYKYDEVYGTTKRDLDIIQDVIFDVIKRSYGGLSTSISSSITGSKSKNALSKTLSSLSLDKEDYVRHIDLLVHIHFESIGGSKEEYYPDSLYRQRRPSQAYYKTEEEQTKYGAKYGRAGLLLFVVLSYISMLDNKSKEYKLDAFNFFLKLTEQINVFNCDLIKEVLIIVLKNFFDILKHVKSIRKDFDEIELEVEKDGSRKNQERLYNKYRGNSRKGTFKKARTIVEKYFYKELDVKKLIRLDDTCFTNINIQFKNQFIDEKERHRLILNELIFLPVSTYASLAFSDLKNEEIIEIVYPRSYAYYKKNVVKHFDRQISRGILGSHFAYLKIFPNT